ncbi:MAG: 50S ribosomal protein L4 [Candidatus Hydrogenedens sp.]|jgi:large subunit ribosomal protein L4|nr:50S ribosomal protein L4 [Candidatus Hydrogenedens sp.]
MVTLKVVDMQGVEQTPLEVNEAVFNVEVSDTLLHDVVVGLQANQRQGTHSTKTRSEVSGGGAKPFRQKGTGRARRGSTREPLLKGGGVAFGPKPRSYRNKVTAGMKRQALCGLLSDRARTERLCVLSDFAIDAPKTRTFADMIKAIDADARKTLLVVADHNPVVLLSSRNIPNVAVRTAADVNALDVISASRIVLQQEALPKLEERLT